MVYDPGACAFKYAPGVYLVYAPGALCIQICFLEYNWYMFLEHCAFKYAP